MHIKYATAVRNTVIRFILDFGSLLPICTWRCPLTPNATDCDNELPLLELCSKLKLSKFTKLRAWFAATGEFSVGRMLRSGELRFFSNP